MVGAGLAGAWLAYVLRRRGYDVTVYEAHEPGYGASSRAAGIVSFQLPPSMLELAAEGYEAYRDLGVLRPARSYWIPRPQERRCALRVADALSSLGFAAREVDARELRWMHVGGDDTVIEMYQGVVSPSDAMAKLLRGDGGLWVREGAVRRGADGRLRVDGQPLEGGLVFVAAGPWTAELVGLRGLVVYRCSAFSVESEEEIGAIVEDDASDFYIVPEGGRRYILGAQDDTIVLPDEGFVVSDYEAYEALSRASRRLPAALTMRPLSSWAAPCVTSADGLPVAGEVDGTFVLTALDGAGLTLSPALARALADLAEGVGGGELERYSPGRLARLAAEGPPRARVEPFDLICEG